MEALKVGIREFREKMASYLLESDVPVAIPAIPLATTFLPDINGWRRSEQPSKKQPLVCSKCLPLKASPRTRFLRTSSADTRRAGRERLAGVLRVI